MANLRLMKRDIWTLEQANAWYDSRPWICGYNYVPSTAVNSTEMWQSATFDPQTIERELQWAREIGLNACRVFLQELVWKHEQETFLDHFEAFLDIAARYGQSVMPILFDDCAFGGKEPYPGRQEAPTPFVHNSGWTPSPAHWRVVDTAEWPMLQAYARAVVGRFRDDPRILLWDVYNEPGNEGMGDKSAPLLEAAFQWVRAMQPIQPVTAGIWDLNHESLNARMLALSDVLSFHCYEGPEAATTLVRELQRHRRPILCTEWMRRGYDSHFETHLPLWHRERVGCFFWGLVNGRTQTHFPWGWNQEKGEPKDWFHDLLHADGQPYRQEEIALIQSFSGH